MKVRPSSRSQEKGDEYEPLPPRQGLKELLKREFVTTLRCSLMLAGSPREPFFSGKRGGIAPPAYGEGSPSFVVRLAHGITRRAGG